MELDFDKYCKLSASPNTVLPPLCRRSKADKRKSIKKDPTLKDNLFTLEEDFTEINFHRFRSVSCKNVPSRTSGLKRNDVLRRGSVYQSSHERTKMKNIEEFEGRKKIELSEKDSIFSSFEIVDSLCSSDEDTSLSETKRYPNLESDKIESSQFKESSIGFHKSLSAKVSIPQSRFQSENDSSKPSSPKARFGIKKMLDPFTKSKSQRSPLGPSSEPTTKHEKFRKSLMSDYLKTPKVLETVSPAHLHGFLKLETKHGTPFFEFSLTYVTDVLVARRWKAENGLNWVYTFHSFANKRKSNATSQWEPQELKKGTSMVAQMQVSCYLRTNAKGEGAFDNSMITEFVTYDVTKTKDFDILAKKSMEIAACVVQTPHEKRESLKHKGGDETNLLDLCEEKGKRDHDFRVNVVIPSGIHGLPNADVVSCGPSSLLERWRSNGACDCGGWDMACPLTVFGNSDTRSIENRLVLENKLPFELFFKGGKENTPALVITAIEEGRYTVDFHAKLSTLQAFSMCVAMLHCTETSINATHEKEKDLLKSDSLRVSVDEEISDLIEAVKEEDKRTEIKRMEKTIPSFRVKPPFSPIARV